MLELRGITKTFPGVKALDNVNLEFKPGEIHGLIGENGAGKSTCMKIICGIYQPNEGKVVLDEEELKFKGYEDALERDISIVNQEIQVIPGSSIAENIMLDKLPRFYKKGRLDWKEMNKEAKKYLELVGLDIDPTEKIKEMSAAHKQLVQIAKALSSNAKYLLLDEPTSSLTLHEVEKLFKILRRLKKEGVCLIFITHKLEELLEVCDRISVLRDGKFVGRCINDESLKRQEIVKLMIGRETEEKNLGVLEPNKDVKALEAKDICQEGRFDNVNFHLNKGEILGFYGLVGSGRTELVKSIIGEYPINSGEIYKDNNLIKISSMSDSLNKHKIGYVSENRKEEGLILDFDVNTNINVTTWSKIMSKITRMVSPSKEREITNKMIDVFHIKTPTIYQKIENLSGGNQQKVSIAKWIAAECDILIVDEPTVGVDVGAKEQIHQIIWDLAKVEGKSIIVISSDLSEMITLARRILVFKENEIVGEIDDLNITTMSSKEISMKIGEYIT